MIPTYADITRHYSTAMFGRSRTKSRDKANLNIGVWIVRLRLLARLRCHTGASSRWLAAMGPVAAKKFSADALRTGSRYMSNIKSIRSALVS